MTSSLHSSPKCGQRFAAQLIGGDHKYTIRLRVHNIHDPQEPAVLGTSNRDSRAVLSGPIFRRTTEHIAHLLFHDLMTVDVRKLTLRIDIKPDFQTGSLLPANLRPRKRPHNEAPSPDQYCRHGNMAFNLNSFNSTPSTTPRRALEAVRECATPIPRGTS